MYILDPAKKEDPIRRWGLPDRIFFGHGACHILAGMYLELFPQMPFRPFMIQPAVGFTGSHVFVCDGQIAFDYHGYSVAERLTAHHRKVWTFQYPDWDADVLPVDFPLLDTHELNARNMRGPDQYLADAAQRARRYLLRIDHETAATRARGLAG